MTMTSMTLHDRQKNKYSARILWRFGLCLTTKYFRYNHVFRVMEHLEPGSLSPVPDGFQSYH